MYLYGYKKANLTQKIKDWLDIIVDEYDILGYSAGKGLLTFGRYTITIENLHDDIASVIENIYYNWNEEKRSEILTPILDFDKEDLNSLNSYIVGMNNTFFTTFAYQKDMENENVQAEYRVIKRNGEYQQLVLALPQCKDFYSILVFDANLKFVEKIDTTIGERKTIVEYVNNNFDVAKGITMEVLTSGISSRTKSAKLGRVFVVDETSTVIPEGVYATYLSQTYVIKYHDKVMGAYIAKPMENPKEWYMNSGNFITSSNCMYKFHYAIPVFDHTEP